MNESTFNRGQPQAVAFEALPQRQIIVIIRSRFVQFAISARHVPGSRTTIDHYVAHTNLNSEFEHFIACGTDAQTGAKGLRCLLLWRAVWVLSDDDCSQ